MSKRMARVSWRDESGISLVELLVAMTISALLMGPIGFAIYFGTKSTGATQEWLTQSNKTSFLASYFSPDVESSTSVKLNVSDGTCGAAATKVVDLQLTQVGQTVSYYHETSSAGTFLYRRVCNGTAIVVGPLKVSSNLPAQQPPPGGGSPVANPLFQCPGDCSTSAKWAEIKLVIAQQDVANAAKGNAVNRFQTVLEATKRVTGQ